jgi:hypothetical protein
MRHLNEIVRERNQYSRDAMEAWQDFINLKGRLDTELSKVTKRNNFLVEELETWKQQVRNYLDIFDIKTNIYSSSSNSRHLPSSSRRRHPTSRSRSKATSARTVASVVSSTSRKTTSLVLLFVFPAPKSSATMPWKLWFSSKKSPRSWSGNASATTRIFPPWNTAVLRFLVNVTKPSAL